MGGDKASLRLPTGTMAQTIADALIGAGLAVTVLGRQPLPGLPFQMDGGEFEGPLRAIAAFEPTKKFVFACSCDLPLFDARLIQLLWDRMGNFDAAIPAAGDRLQPLCALYRSAAFEAARSLASEGERRIMAWIDTLNMATITQADLGQAGISPLAIRSANTPQELEALLGP